MDPVTLATAAAALLTPFIKKMGDVAFDKLSEKLPEEAGKVWNAIAERFKGNPAASGSAEMFSKHVDDEDNQQAFILQIKKILKEDESFANHFEKLLQNAQKAVNLNTGDGSVASGDNSNAVGKIEIGGNVNGNIVIGNNNKVNSNQ